MPYKDQDKRREYHRKYYHKNNPKWQSYRKATQHRRHLKYFYGMSLDDYQNLVKAQDSKCAICEEQKDKLFVDHVHEGESYRKGKRVRGLLCSKCNLLIGHARESERILISAIAYLRKHESI